MPLRSLFFPCDRLYQAATAVGMLRSFLGRVSSTCASTGLTATQVVNALESAS
jgi:hypothetical protein